MIYDKEEVSFYLQLSFWLVTVSSVIEKVGEESDLGVSWVVTHCKGKNDKYELKFRTPPSIPIKGRMMRVYESIKGVINYNWQNLKLFPQCRIFTRTRSSV